MELLVTALLAGLGLQRGARRFAAADLPRPFRLARFCVDLDKEEIIALLRRKKRGVAPDDGRTGGGGVEGEFPEDVGVVGPLERQAGFGADAVAGRSAPLRPVAGLRRCVNHEGNE